MPRQAAVKSRRHADGKIADHGSSKSDDIVKTGDAHIHRAIYSAIVEHHLPPGTKLSEDDLASVFGVSRTKIRAVLLKLSHDRIVTLHKNRGAFVAKPSLSEARDVFAARRLVEIGAVAGIVHGINTVHLRRLRSVVGDERKAQRLGNQETMIALSGQFHVELMNILGNAILSEFVRGLVSRTSLVIAVYQRPGESVCHYDDHSHIIDCLAAHDIAQVTQAMQQHLQEIEESVSLDDVAPSKVNARNVLASLRGIVSATTRKN